MTPNEKELSAAEDRELVAKMKAGDEKAFERIYKKYWNRVLKIEQRIVKDDGQAEDLAQEVFLTLYEKICGFRGDSKFHTWLSRVAVNRALMVVREKKPVLIPVIFKEDRRRESFLIKKFTTENGELFCKYEMSDDGFLVISDVGKTNGIAEVSSRLLLEQIIPALPKMYREVIRLRDFEGFSYEEIGQMTGCTVPAMKSRHQRALGIMLVEIAAHYNIKLRQCGGDNSPSEFIALRKNLKPLLAHKVLAYLAEATPKI